jgi:outer membrane protein TolC
MTMRRALALFVICLPSVASAESTRLTIDDVVRVATASHPSLTAARARAVAARDLAKSAGGRMLPAITVSDEYQHYNDVFAPAFPVAGPAPAPSIQVRDQNTNTFVASASQPIAGLLRRSEDYKARARSAEAADAGVAVAESATREALQTEYLHMFEARAMQEIARVSESELGEQVVVTAAAVKAGTLTQADLLRVKVAQANARQQGIAAQTQVTLSRASLLSAIGSDPGDASVEFVEPAALLDAAEGPAPRASAESAVERRPEIAQAALSAAAARHQARARGYAMLPEVDLEGAYLRVDGQVFAPKNSGYVGMKASWPIWEWGASAHERSAAAAQADAAEADLEAERRRVRVEVASRAAQLDAAASAVDVANEAIASAEEAYRVMQVSVRAGAATVTDLLDSQAALTGARLNATRARYERAIAKVALDRATGAR